jgi:hypothetical protein
MSNVTYLNLTRRTADRACSILEQYLLLCVAHFAKQHAGLRKVVVVLAMIPVCRRAANLERWFAIVRLFSPFTLVVRLVADRAAMIAVDSHGTVTVIVIHGARLLRERYPDLQLALREDLTANLLLRMEDGQFDFALIALLYDTANLLVEPLFDDDLWVIGRKGDPELAKKSIHFTQSLTDRLLLLEEGHCLRDQTLYACNASSQKSTSGMEATSLLPLVQMIESGFGIGLVPEMAINSGLTESPNLVARPTTKPCPKRTIALVARRSTSRLTVLRTVADLIRSTNGANPVLTASVPAIAQRRVSLQTAADAAT